MIIVYCLPQIYNPGGIERTTTIKANYFAEAKGWEVIIITACQKGKVPFYPLSDKVRVIDLGVEYDQATSLPIFLRIQKRWGFQKIHKKKLSDLLMNLKADVVVSTLGNEAAFLPSIKDGSKKILEFHFCRGHKRMMANAYHYPLLTKYAFYFRCWQEEHIIIPQYDQFVVLTKEDKQNWIGLIPNVVNIANPLPFEKEGKAKLTKKHAIGVGRLDAQKGFGRMIDIWAKVSACHPDWVLDIYGKGDDYDNLQHQIHRLNLEGKVVLHGAVKCIKDCYLNSSIFLMTSVYEGIGMNLLESVGLGLPSVCYAFPCGPKDIIVNGQNGLLVENGCEEKFVRCVCRLIEDEEYRMLLGQKAYELSSEYSKEVIMSKWEDLFNNLTKM